MNRQRLADYLSEYAHGVVEEWMRLIDISENVLSPGSEEIQARVTWAGDGTFKVSTTHYGEELGHFRLVVRVEPIDVPPIGPENDPAQIHEPKHPCEECNHSHSPNRCPNLYLVCEECNTGGHTCPGDGNSIEHGQSMCDECKKRFLDEAEAAEPLEWVPATWGETMQNDRVRLGGAEAVIEGFSKLDWHTTIERSFQKPDGKWWDLVRPFEHTSVHVRLAGRTDLLTFPPDSPVDILCTPTRRAMLTLTRGGLS